MAITNLGGLSVHISKQSKKAFKDNWQLALGSVVLPYFKELESEEFTVLIVLDRPSFEKMVLSQSHLRVALFSVDSPVSTNGKISATEIAIRGEMRMTFDLRSSKAESVCARKGTSGDWERQYCSVQVDSSDNQAICCGQQFGEFAAINKDYFATAKENRSLQSVLSLIPSMVVLVILIAGIIQASASVKKNGKQIQESSRNEGQFEAHQPADNTTEENSSPEKLSDNVSTMSIPQAIANTSQKVVA